MLWSPHLRVVRDGTERECPHADAHERWIVTARRGERPLGDARLIPGFHPTPRELLDDVILVRSIWTRLLEDLRGHRSINRWSAVEDRPSSRAEIFWRWTALDIMPSSRPVSFSTNEVFGLRLISWCSFKHGNGC